MERNDSTKSVVDDDGSRTVGEIPLQGCCVARAAVSILRCS